MASKIDPRMAKGIFFWTDVTGTSQTMVAGTGYFADNASQVVFTLPASCKQGDEVAIVGVNTGGWTVSGSGMTIRNNASSDLTLSSSSAGPSVHLVCTADNTTWQVRSSVGTLTDYTGPTKGYFPGGYNGYSGAVSAIIKTIQFSNESTSTNTNNLGTGVQGAAGGASTTFGWTICGSTTGSTPQTVGTVQKLTFSNANVASTGISLTTPTVYATSGQGSAKVYALGGIDSGGTYLNKVQGVAMSNDAVSTGSNNLLATVFGSNGCSSSTAAYVMGGATSGGFGGTGRTAIEKLTFSGEATSTSGSSLGATVMAGSNSAYSSTKGYCPGGFSSNTASAVTSIITFSNDAISTAGTTLNPNRGQSSAANSTTKAYVGGGATTGNVGSPSQIKDTIDAILFSNDSDSVVSATMSEQTEPCGGFAG